MQYPFVRLMTLCERIGPYLIEAPIDEGRRSPKKCGRTGVDGGGGGWRRRRGRALLESNWPRNTLLETPIRCTRSRIAVARRNLPNIGEESCW